MTLVLGLCTYVSLLMVLARVFFPQNRGFLFVFSFRVKQCFAARCRLRLSAVSLQKHGYVISRNQEIFSGCSGSYEG